MHILVTGGTGFLGQHLVRALLARQYSVSMVGRDFAGVQDLVEAGAIPICADLHNTVMIREACKGMDVVFHAGALSAAWGRRSDFYATNVEGTRAVLEGCYEHGIKRMIYVSSPSVVFEGRDIEDATEAMAYPRRFTSVYAHTKKLGEDLVNAASARLETVILRPKAIFGPGDRTLLPQLIAVARQGRLPQIGDGRNLVDLTYVDNVVQALLCALDAQAAVGKTYTITNDEHVPLWDMIRQVLSSLDLSTDLRRVPFNLALLVAVSMEARATLTGKAPLLTRYTVAILGRTQTYNIEAARQDLGYSPSVSVTEGVRQTLDVLKMEA